MWSAATMVNDHYLNSKTNSKLHPWFITGYSDGESSFSIRVRTSPSSRFGFNISIVYSIGAEVNPVNKNLLEQVKEYFTGAGSISKSGNMYYYEITSLKSLINVRKHFEEFPLRLLASDAFKAEKCYVCRLYPITLLCKKILQSILAFYENTSTLGFKIRRPFQRGGFQQSSRGSLKFCFKPFKPKFFSTMSSKGNDKILVVNSNSIPDQSVSNLTPVQSKLRGSTLSNSEFLEWFRGISDGEASFHINLKHKDGSIVRAEFRFNIQLHKDDEPLLLYIKNRLGFGTVKVYGNAVRFSVDAKENLLKIIKIFWDRKLNTSKYLNFLAWKEAFEISSDFRSKPKVKRDEIKANVLFKVKQLKDLFNTNRKDFKLPEDHSISITPYWLLGFVEGEGSFYMQKSQYVIRFEIGQSIVDQKVMLAIQGFLLELPENKKGKGGLKDQAVYFIQDSKPQNERSKVMCKVGTFNPSYIKNNLIPFLDNLEWISKKRYDYQDWKILLSLKEKGWHLCSEGREVIQAIANIMNSKRLSTTDSSLIPTIPSSHLDAKIKFLLENTNLETHADGKIWIKSEKKYLSGGKKTKINCFNEEGLLVQNFESITEAALYFNLSKATISNKLNTGSLLPFKGEFLKLTREPL